MKQPFTGGLLDKRHPRYDAVPERLFPSPLATFADAGSCSAQKRSFVRAISNPWSSYLATFDLQIAS